MTPGIEVTPPFPSFTETLENRILPRILRIKLRINGQDKN